jgi:hypothetical protein
VYCAGEKEGFLIKKDGSNSLVVKHYFRKASYPMYQDAFQKAFPNDTVPNKTTICRIIRKFEETGSV